MGIEEGLKFRKRKKNLDVPVREPEPIVIKDSIEEAKKFEGLDEVFGIDAPKPTETTNQTQHETKNNKSILDKEAEKATHIHETVTKLKIPVVKLKEI